MFSREKNAGVLVMNDVPPPIPGTVYQMWLIGEEGPTSAGTMDEQAVAPSTTAVLPDLGNSTTLAFTVEPGTGSQRPTTPVDRQAGTHLSVADAASAMTSATSPRLFHACR